jgi:hypothetical protein
MLHFYYNDEKMGKNFSHNQIGVHMSCKWAVNISEWKPSNEVWISLLGRLEAIEPDEVKRIKRYHFPNDAKR